MTNLNRSNLPDFDESLLEANLKLTVEQRIITHDDALEVALEFKRAGQALYKNRNSSRDESITDHE